MRPVVPWSGRIARPAAGVRPWLGTRQERVQRAAGALVVPETPEDSYRVGQLSDGFEVAASLVNVVHLSRVRCVDGGQEHGVSAIALQQALLGIASMGLKSTHTKELVIKYVAPFRGKHAVTTADLRLQETAATSGSVGRATVDVTMRLLQEAGGCPIPLYAHERRDNNEVYTAFVNFPIDLALLQRLFPKHITKPKKFEARVIRPPDFVNKRLLVFPRGIIICVGSNGPEGMLEAMRAWLPRIEEARTERLLPRKKRRRDQQDD